VKRGSLVFSTISLGIMPTDPMKTNSCIFAMFLILAIGIAAGQTLPVCSAQASNGTVIILAVVIGNAPAFSPPGFFPQAIAPGELVAVNGIWINGSVSVSTSNPLPTKINGIELLVNDVPVPLMEETLNNKNLPFVWQMTAQVPFSIPVGGTAAMRLRITNPDNSQCLSGYIQVPVVHAMPALATNSAGSALILNQDNTANSTTNPAAAQQVATVYGVGFGRLIGPAKAGDVISKAISLAQPVEVTIDGVPALVQYSGSAPGTVGGYQVNFLVPNVGTGSHDGSLQVNGAKTSFRISVK